MECCVKCGEEIIHGSKCENQCGRVSCESQCEESIEVVITFESGKTLHLWMKICIECKDHGVNLDIIEKEYEGFNRDKIEDVDWTD